MAIVPPPWTLNGRGAVILAHFPAEFAKTHGFMDSYQRDGYCGWFGTVMLVDYEVSEQREYEGCYDVIGESLYQVFAGILLAMIVLIDSFNQQDVI
jgi:hypothetical protein